MSAKGAVPGTNAYKVGARTGATAGYISPYQSRVKLKQDSYMNAAVSDEWVFMGHSNLPVKSYQPFGNHGDSGAVVYNSQGEVLGLLFAGQKPQQAYPEGFTYITRIEDVFKDIIDFSEGNITDIRIAMS
jgi:S1-C subfamily serine protease